MKKSTIALFFIGLSCLLALASCTLPHERSAPFEDKEWTLQAYRKTKAVEGGNATIQFSNGVVRGSTGCNSFSGEYTFDGAESGKMNITNIAVTEMACIEPEGLMDQEAFFLETLNGAQRYEYSPERLMIYQSGHEALTFALFNN